MSYTTAIMLDNGTMFGFNEARYANYEDDCLIISDADGGRVSLCEEEVLQLYIFLQHFESLILDRQIGDEKFYGKTTKV